MVEVGRNRWRHSSPVSLLRAGLAEGGCSGPCLIDFERMETPQPLWSTCSSTTLTIRTFLCLYRPSCMSCCAHCLSSWHCNAEEFALSSLLLPQVLIRINTYSPWTYYFLIECLIFCAQCCVFCSILTLLFADTSNKSIGALYFLCLWRPWNAVWLASQSTAIFQYP